MRNNRITSALIKQNIQHALVLARAHTLPVRAMSSFWCECRTLSSRSIFVVVVLGTLICICSTHDDKKKYTRILYLLLLCMDGLADGARNGEWYAPHERTIDGIISTADRKTNVLMFLRKFIVNQTLHVLRRDSPGIRQALLAYNLYTFCY